MKAYILHCLQKMLAFSFDSEPGWPEDYNGKISTQELRQIGILS